MKPADPVFVRLAVAIRTAREKPVPGARADVLYRDHTTRRWNLAGGGDFSDADVAKFLAAGSVVRIPHSGDLQLPPRRAPIA